MYCQEEGEHLFMTLKKRENEKIIKSWFVEDVNLTASKLEEISKFYKTFLLI